MYENLSQKIKRYVKIFTIVAMVMVLIGGIAAAFILIRRGGQLSTLLGIGMIFLAAIMDILLYYTSLFAYGFGEMLEQQATQINLSRQILNAQRDAHVPAPEKQPAVPVPPRQPAAPTPTYSTGYPAYPSPAQRPAYPYPPQQPEHPWSGKVQQEPAWQPKPQPPYGQYPGSYRTQNPYGTSTGFNEDYHYEPKR